MTDPITSDSVVTAKPGLMASEIDGELVMMDESSGTYFSLDPVAAAIWHRLAEPASVSVVCASLLDEFDVDEATCHAETLAFLEELRAANLITFS